MSYKRRKNFQDDIIMSKKKTNKNNECFFPSPNFNE